MTGPQLKTELKARGLSQLELARRVGKHPRYVQLWAERGVPEKWIEAVRAAMDDRPRIHLSREERTQTADLLDKAARDFEAVLYTEKESKAAAILRDKIRASVGGSIRPV